MSVRLTGGRHGGRVIATHAPSGVRPTAGKVRQALFNMIGQDLSGWTVLDAFGGTGLLGFEAWSRGAERVTICEKSAAAGVMSTCEVRTCFQVLESCTCQGGHCRWVVGARKPAADEGALDVQ